MEYVAHRAIARHTSGRRAVPNCQRRSGRLGIADIALIAVCAAVLLWALIVAGPRPAAPDVGQWTPVLVSEHTTVWDLATAHPIPGRSTAETVATIRAHNGLATATLVVGQSLEVPADAGTSAHVARR